MNGCGSRSRYNDVWDSQIILIFGVTIHAAVMNIIIVNNIWTVTN